MAATSTSPISASPPRLPSHRKPLPLQISAGDTRGRVGDAGGKALPSIPLESPRLRDPPRSPVRVNVKPDDWAKPSNATVEDSETEFGAHYQATSERDLPKEPAAPPPPPPYSPTYDDAGQPSTREGALPMHTKAECSENSPPLPHGSPQGPSAQSGLLSPGSSQPGSKLGNNRRTSYTDDSLVDDVSTSDGTADTNRRSRDTDTTFSTSQQPTSTRSSAPTSASSVSGINEADEGKDVSAEDSLEDFYEEAQNESVPQLQYHHQAFLPEASNTTPGPDPRNSSNPELAEQGAAINRHLTPSSNFMRPNSLPRPHSSYSVYSELGARGRSPGSGVGQARAPSAQSRKSPDMRPASYADMLGVPYPQPAPAPITLDNSNLRTVIGSNASLLSTQKTLEMYRQNVKKTNDASIQYSFAVFLISTAQEQGLSFTEPPMRKNSPKPGRESPQVDGQASSPQELVREARSILQKLSNAGYPFAQYYLADGFASGLFAKGKEDYNAAFPLFVIAAKHGHAESAYRAALCYEFGWGCRKDPAKAVQYLRIAASKRHPGAMTRLGKACLSGDLGEKRYREGIKWLKLATESADAIYNAAPYQLACLYETGYGDDIFQDEAYAAELFTQAAELGHPEASYRMGDAYEHGKLNCPRDPALSVHFYTGAAERGHAGAMMGLCAWYMVGAEPILEKDEEEAYEWARRSAAQGFVKAQYAVGYFTESGIGCRRDMLEANVWYVKAADAGDERAKQRLAAIRAAASGGVPMDVAPPRNGKVRKASGENDKDCIVM